MSKNIIIGRWRACAIAAMVVLAGISDTRANDPLGEFLRQAGQQLLQAVPPPATPRAPAVSKPRRAEGRNSQPADADEGPSFSCTRKLRPTEKAICASTELAHLDRKLAEAFTAAWTAADGQGRVALKRDQRAWLAQRAGCGTDPDCIAGMMTQRTAELFGQSGMMPVPEQPRASGTAESGNAPEPSDGLAGAQSGKAQSRTGAVRDAPPADYRTLLAMMMDYRPDDYRSDDFATYWYGWNLHSDDAECQAARTAWEAVTTRPAFVRSVRGKLDDALSRATKAPSGRPLKLSLRVEANSGDYDVTTHMLNLRPILLRGISQDQKFSWSSQNAALNFAPVSVDYCYIGQSMMAIRMLGGISVSLDLARIPRFSLEPSDLDERARGTQIGKQNSGLVFKVDLIAEVSISDTGISGHVLSGRVSDPVNGRVLASFDGNQLTDQNTGEPASAAPANSAAVMPALDTLVKLAALRSKPDLISEEAIEDRTLRQIKDDQNAYNEARRSGATTYGGQERHQFVFSAAEVADRSAEFVMPSLVPKMRAAIAKVTAKAPTRFWAEQPLGAPHYDHVRQMVTFDCCYARDSRIPGAFDMMMPSGQEGVGANMISPKNAATADPSFKDRAIYGFAMVSDPPEYGPGAPVPPPVRQLSEFVRAARLVLPSQFPDLVLGLDRVLEIKEIPLEPSRMEAVMKQLERHAGVNDSVHSRVAFTLEKVVDSPDKRYLIMLAHVDSVTLLSPDNTVLAELPLDSFPLAADRWNQIAGTASQATEDAAKVKAEQARSEAERIAKANADATSALEKARASVEEAAQGALRGPYGPDVVGIRLGMTFEEADAIIRKHMDVGWVITNPATPMSNQTDANIPDISSLRGYFSRDRNEAIVLLDMPPEAAGRVLGVTRGFNVALGTGDSDIETALVQKYGKPDRKDVDPPPVWRWGHDGGPCGVPARGLPRDVSIVEGPQSTNGFSTHAIDSMGVYRFSFPTGGQTPELAVWADCGPSIKVYRNHDRVEVSLADNRLYAAFLMQELRKNVEQAGASHPIKF